MKRTALVGAVSLLIGLGISSESVEAAPPGSPPGPPPGPAADIEVLCPDDSIQDAVDSVARGGMILIIGACTENVLIVDINGLTIMGDPESFGSIAPADLTLPPIDIDRSSGVRLENLTLDASAGQYGLFLSNGDAEIVDVAVLTDAPGTFTNIAVLVNQNGALTMTDSIAGPSDYGLFVQNGGHARVVDSIIENNTAAGVFAHRNGSLDLRAGTIVQGNYDGVSALDGSSVRMRPGTQIIDNTHDGVFGARNASFNIDGVTIGGLDDGNGRDGVHISGASSVRLKDATVEYNGRRGVHLNTGSAAEINNSSVSHNGDRGVRLVKSSSADIFGGSTIDFNGHRGVHATGGSSVKISGSSVSDNVNRGVVIAEGSTAFIGGSTINNNNDRGVWAYANSSIELTGGNTVSGNVRYGVRAQNNSNISIYDDNVISGHTRADVSVVAQSFGSIFTNTPGLVSTLGNVRVQEHSNLQMETGAASSIVVGDGSTVIFFDFAAEAPITVAGNVDCFSSGPAPASAAFFADALVSGTPAGGLSLGGTTNCTTLLSQGF